MEASETIDVEVEKVIQDVDNHYAVVTINGEYVTFSIDTGRENCAWIGDTPPEFGEIVRCSFVRKTKKGWRANRVERILL